MSWASIPQIIRKGKVMKTLSLVVLLVASLAFVMLGCSDSPGPVVGPNDQAISATTSSSALAKMGADMHSATGNGHWRMIGTQSRVRFSFSAIQHADGSLSGEVRNNDEGPTFKMHARVWDLMVDGNTAKICFTFSKGSIYGPPGGPYTDISGWLACVVVVDNGDGKDTEADLVSLVEGGPPCYEYESGVTVEDLLAKNIDDFLAYILDWYQQPYSWFMPAIDQGSVKVR
jgi:hypothetical protein